MSKLRIFIAALFNVIFLFLLVSSVSVSASKELLLETGDSVVLKIADVKKVAVGEPRIADVKVLSDTEIMVVSKAEGGTTLMIWSGDSLVNYRIIVYSRQIRTLADEITNAISISGLAAKTVGSGIILIGEAASDLDKQYAENIASRFTKDITNMIRVRPELPQIQVKVKMVEVSKEDLKELGINWQETPDGIGILNLNSLIKSSDPTELILNKIKFWVDEGKAKLLAEPTLVTLAGTTASFMAGGEIPIPVISGGETSIQWKNYGVSLTINPHQDINGKLILKIKPEVSTLDWSNTVKGTSTSLPTMKKRSAETELRLVPNSSIMLAGLIQQEQTESISRFPFLGSLPILGELFKSTRFINKETELLVFLTPTIVAEPK